MPTTDGTITAADICNQAVVERSIRNGAVASVKLAADIQSDTYDGGVIGVDPGTTGWRIERNTGDAVFDGAYIRGALSAATISADDITAGTLAAGVLYGGRIDADRINVFAESDNLWPDGGFEGQATDILNYALLNGCTLAFETTSPIRGQASLKIDYTAQTGVFEIAPSNGSGPQERMVVHRPGDTYRAEIDHKLFSGTAQEMLLRVIYWDQNGSFLDSDDFAFTPTGTLTKLEGNAATDPVGASAVNFSIRMANGAGSGVVLVDNVRIVKKNIGVLIADDTITAGNIAANTITAAEIAANTITASEIAADTITASEIAANTITASQLAANTITTSQISLTAGITGSQLANDTVSATQISPGTITVSEISGTAGITGGQIASTTITGGNIATGTITAAKIQANTITAAEIAAGTITASEIASGTITASQIAANTITASQISLTAGITGGQIAGTTITAGNIATGTITATQIAATTITAAEIAGGTITGAKIASSTITGSNIAGTTITGSNIANSTITGGKIAGSTITGSNIAGGTITGSLIANSTIADANIISISGNTVSSGTITAVGFQTASSGSRLVIDQTNKERIKFYDGATLRSYTGVFAGGSGATGYTIAVDGAQRLWISSSILTLSTYVRTSQDGSAGAPSYSFDADTNTGMYRVTTDQLGFATGGTVRLQISTTVITPSLYIRTSQNGSKGAPAYSFDGSTNTGMYRSGSNISLAAGGSKELTLTTAGLYCDSITGSGTGFQNLSFNAAENQFYRFTSSARYKKNIREISPDELAAAARKVRLHSFTPRKGMGEDRRHLGLIAEQVAEVFPDAVGYVDGRPDYLRDNMLTYAALAAVQDLYARIERLEEAAA